MFLNIDEAMRDNRCRYCGSDMTDDVTPTAYLENPFCSGCIRERIDAASLMLGPIENRVVGRYLEPIRSNAG